MMQSIRQIGGRWRVVEDLLSLELQVGGPPFSHDFLHPEKPFSFFFYNKSKMEKKGRENKKEQLAQCPCILCFPDTHV